MRTRMQVCAVKQQVGWVGPGDRVPCARCALVLHKHMLDQQPLPGDCALGRARSRVPEAHVWPRGRLVEERAGAVLLERGVFRTRVGISRISGLPARSGERRWGSAWTVKWNPHWVKSPQTEPALSLAFGPVSGALLCISSLLAPSSPCCPVRPNPASPRDLKRWLVQPGVYLTVVPGCMECWLWELVVVRGGGLGFQVKTLFQVS